MHTGLKNCAAMPLSTGRVGISHQSTPLQKRTAQSNDGGTKAMLKPKVNVFKAGEVLLAAKKEVVNQCVEKAKSEGTSLAAPEKNGARFF